MICTLELEYSQILNNNIKIQKVRKMSSSNKSTWLEEYKDCFTFKTKPVTEFFLRRFFSDLIQEAKNNEEILVMRELFLNKGVPSRTYYGWVKRYPIATEANEFIKDIVGARREKGAIQCKLNAAMVLHTMPLYDDEAKKLVEWKSALRQKEETSKGNITVMMEPFGKTTKKLKKELH